MRRFLLRTAFTGVLLVISSWAFGISKVGGGTQNLIGSKTSQFQAELPRDYVTSSKSSDATLVLQTYVFTGAAPGVDLLLVREADIFQPEWLSLSRAQLAERLRRQNFEHVEFEQNPCVEAWVLPDAQQFNFIVLWGPGKGIVMAGTNPKRMSSTIQLFLQSLQLDPGACAWN